MLGVYDIDFSEMRSLFHIEGNIGFDKEEIKRAENKWGALPTVLKDYYRQLGAHERLNRTQNFLRRPDDLFHREPGLCRLVHSKSRSEGG